VRILRDFKDVRSLGELSRRQRLIILYIPRLIGINVFFTFVYN